MEVANFQPQRRQDTLARQRITEGRLGSALARFGTPLAFGMGLQTTFNLVDAYIISRLEHEVASAALGAIGICDPLAAVGTIISYGISVATAAILSRKQGEGDAEGVRQVAWQSLLLVLGLGVAFGAFGLVAARWVLAEVIHTKGDVVALGTPYLRLMVGGSVSVFLLLHLTTIQRALGSSKSPVLMLLAGNLLNFLLSVLLVYGPGPAPPVFAWAAEIARVTGIPRMGLMGAAWATILSRLLVLVPLVWVLMARFGLFKRGARTGLDASIAKGVWSVAWPTSIQLVIRILAMLLTHTLVARAYTTEEDQTATTALGIVFRPETMALFVGLGWGSAAQTFVGQNLGAGHRERAQQSGWLAMGFNAAMMVAFAAVYVLLAEPIVAFFDPTPAVVETARGYVRWVAPSYVGLGIGVVLGSAIQGAGATRQTLRLDLLVVGLVQLPTCAAVAALQLPPERLWQALSVTYVAYAVVYVVSYRRGKHLDTRLA
jgi:putative MATE family efflux protein